GVAVTSALESHPSSPVSTAWHKSAGTGPALGAHLTVRYRHEPWGTQMEANVTGLRPGSVCELQVTDNTGGTPGGGRSGVWGGAGWCLWRGTSGCGAARCPAEKSRGGAGNTIRGGGGPPAGAI